MAFRSLALAAGTSLLVGCSFLTSLDGLGPSDGAANDGSPMDTTGSDVVTAPDGGDAGGNLLENPSFDDGQGGCGPGWGNGYGMTFTRVSPGRTGPYACEVCIQGTQSSYAFDSLPTVPVQAGSYYAEAWLMTPEGGVPVDNGVGVLVNYDIDAGISACSGIGNVCQGSFAVPPTGTWQQSTASFVANGSGTVTISIHAFGGTPSSCFVVDDVALYAQ